MSAQPSPPDRTPSWPVRVRRRVVGTIVDRPLVVSAVLTVLVAVHGVLTWPWEWINPYQALLRSENLGTAVTIYLFTAAAAALVAALAGVIIVFVVGAQTPQMRQFRREAGPPLRTTWIAVVAEPFVAAFLGVIASVTQTTSGGIVAPWLFELGMALLAHSAVRLTLLLGEMVRIVAADDERATRPRVGREDLFPNAS